MTITPLKSIKNILKSKSFDQSEKIRCQKFYMTVLQCRIFVQILWKDIEQKGLSQNYLTCITFNKRVIVDGLISPRSTATRFAKATAEILRGCVTKILVPNPRPRSRRSSSINWGTCVDFPDPVSPGKLKYVFTLLVTGQFDHN